MSLDGAITNFASWAGNTMMPDGWYVLAGAVYHTTAKRAGHSSTFSMAVCFADVLGDAQALEGIRSAPRTHQCRNLGSRTAMSLVRLDRKRNPAHVYAVAGPSIWAE